MSFKGNRLLALGFGIALSVPSVQGSQRLAIKKINLPRIPEAVVASNNLPRRDAPLRVAALRVEFVRDTLSTTTGNGGFDYGYNDSNYFDPPPHDSLYFADHIEFQNFYWDKMSAGNLGFSCDVFPAGARAAYQLPKQMWQYNYNNGAAQLDKGLAELFRDAIQVADSDAAVVWSNYDLVIIFHAGAGAEFDLGFSSTPHDLPSAWMVPEDFRVQLNLPNGIPVEGGSRLVSSGLILPETETHEGVQISMAGVISLMIGHWLGLPALYDKDEGDPVVGKWSMMDRGFGNFYGSLPGPVDVWSASHMGWMTVPDAATGGNQIFARFYDGPEAQPLSPRSYRIPVSSQEEFILECRYRDPENDSVAYAWDRDGRKMTYKDDYSVEVELGFRVPVRADDFDFDSPGSGIVIWHHDGGLDALIDEGRFNSVDENRGLDIEEADGAQDIGRNYPFLTPGYGTDYGIFEDAWYGDNSAYKDANQGRLVSFNDDSYPNSRSNSEAFTHVKVDSISRRGNVMGFRVAVRNELFKLDRTGTFIIDNFDDDLDNEELAVFNAGAIEFYDHTGALFNQIIINSAPNSSEVVARDVTNDGRSDLFWTADSGVVTLMSQPGENWQMVQGFFPDSILAHSLSQKLVIGGSYNNEIIATICRTTETAEISNYYLVLFNQSLTAIACHRFSTFNILNPDSEYPISLSRFGSENSDTFLVKGSHGLRLLTQNGLEPISISGHPYFELNPQTQIADFDASGEPDVLISGQFADPFSSFHFFTLLVIDPITNGGSQKKLLESSDRMVYDYAMDYDNNGRFEMSAVRSVYDRNLNINSDYKLIGIGSNFIGVDNFPQVDPCNWGHVVGMSNSLGSLKLNGSLVNFRSIQYKSNSEEIRNGYNVLQANFPDGRSMPGFPMNLQGVTSVHFMEIDSIPGFDLVVATHQGIKGISLPSSAYRNQSIWWQGPYRDNDHSNAVWEPATPFVAAPGAKLLEDNLCYNWPNPAKGESTAIRYTLNYPATVSVEIFDIAGDKVATLSGPGEAGFPNEIVWDVRNVARGAYLAVVEATGNGKTERKTVKIAVVK